MKRPGVHIQLSHGCCLCASFKRCSLEGWDLRAVWWAFLRPQWLSYWQGVAVRVTVSTGMALAVCWDTTTFSFFGGEHHLNVSTWKKAIKYLSIIKIACSSGSLSSFWGTSAPGMRSKASNSLVTEEKSAGPDWQRRLIGTRKPDWQTLMLSWTHLCQCLWERVSILFVCFFNCCALISWGEEPNPQHAKARALPLSYNLIPTGSIYKMKSVEDMTISE